MCCTLTVTPSFPSTTQGVLGWRRLCDVELELPARLGRLPSARAFDAVRTGTPHASAVTVAVWHDWCSTTQLCRYALVPAEGQNATWHTVNVTDFLTSTVGADGAAETSVSLYGLESSGDIPTRYQVRLNVVTQGTNHGHGVQQLTSGWVETSFATTKATVPQAPTRITTSLVTGGAFQANWCPPVDDGGTSVTHFVVKVIPGSTGVGEATLDTVVELSDIPARVVSAGRPASDPCTVSLPVTGLRHSSTFTVLIAAASSVGDSTPGSTVVTTLAPTPPSVPTNVIQAQVTGGAFVVEWEPPGTCSMHCDTLHTAIPFVSECAVVASRSGPGRCQHCRVPPVSAGRRHQYHQQLR